MKNVYGSIAFFPFVKRLSVQHGKVGKVPPIKGKEDVGAQQK
ncbi:hypothetical protein [Prevotella falsenii]|nr:hypothetical protein [Prevotella falsenii]